jgi:hypothetical protein
LDWSYIKGKEVFELRINFREQDLIKEAEIQANLQISTLSDFKALYAEVEEILSFKEVQFSNIQRSIDIILAQGFDKNRSLGLNLLTEIINQNNSIGLWPIVIFQKIISTDSASIYKLYQIISKENYNYRYVWLFRFFNFLPKEVINSEYLDGFIQIYKNAKEIDFYWPGDLEKFSELKHNLVVEVLRVVVERREVESDFKYTLDHHFISKFISHFKEDLELIKKAYLQQEAIQRNFDYDFEDFFHIVSIDSTFMKEYIEFIYSQREYISGREYYDMHKIWKLPSASKLVYSALLQIIKITPFWRSDDFAQCFFVNLKGSDLVKAQRLIKRFIVSRKTNNYAMTIIMDVVRNTMKDFYQEAVAYLVKSSPSFSLFTKTRWLNNHFTSSGNVIWAEVRVNEWEAILHTLQSLPKQFKYLKHISYVKDNIAAELRNAAWERKMQFIDDRYF